MEAKEVLTSNVWVAISKSILFIVDDQGNYENLGDGSPGNFFNYWNIPDRIRRCAIMLLPPELYHLYASYSYATASEDGFLAGMVYEWLMEIENMDHLKTLNPPGTLGYEMIPYIQQWMYESFQRGKSGLHRSLPIAEGINRKVRR